MTHHPVSFRATQVLMTVAVVGALCLAGTRTTHAQQVFPNPEDAAQALLRAASAREPGSVETIFGPGAKAILTTGDRGEDERRLKTFVEAAQEKLRVDTAAPDRRILVVGRAEWPFPVPLMRKSNGWAFDVAAGREELLNRTIGFNELSAIAACKAYVEAQREYFRQDRDGDEVQEYAQRIISRPGLRDGLYWPPENQADRSPLDGRIQGDLPARAARAGRVPEPYRGYYFRILKAQGRAAPGGAYNYVINGHMLVGFALVAFPAEWGKTGVMTFICNQQGKVFQKNLGRSSFERGRRMTRYDPDKSWTLAD